MQMSYLELVNTIEKQLHVQESFDIVVKPMLNEGVQMQLFFVDGFVKDEILERMMEYLLSTPLKNTIESDCVERFAAKFIPYVEVEVVKELDLMINAVLSGSILLAIEGYDECIIIDARTYPTRGMHEPEDDKVLRGSRDGFVETLIFNTALIRRRIRDARLRMHYVSVGSISKTDVVLCYLDEKASPKLVEQLKARLAQIQVAAITMAHESIAEALVPHPWYNPFPKVRYSERPDVASSNILEGKIILIIDNSPSVLILPTTIFDFIQEAQDYYLPPITGTYLRIIRIGVVLVTLFASPIWYYFNTNPQLAPQFLKFTLIADNMNISIIMQFILLELGIDALKMASLNTPSSLNSSFSIIGALILGDFAVNAGWLAPEIILYMAFVALANFTQPSYELGFAIKFMRILLLVSIAIWPRYGIIIGLLCVIMIMASNQAITKTSYFYPLIPWNGKDFKMIFVRKKIKNYSDQEQK